MTQVVDASAVVAGLLDDGAVGRWCEAQLLAGELIAPHLMPFEVGNIVRRLEARRRVDALEAATAVNDLARMDVELLPFDALASRAWELRANLTVYDACYVAAAELLGCRLVTLDSRLAQAPGLRCDVAVAPQRA